MSITKIDIGVLVGVYWLKWGGVTLDLGAGIL